MIVKSAEQKNNGGITSRDEDYSKWYLDVIEAADLAENSSVRGCMIIKPNGCAIWDLIRMYLDKEFKKTGVQNVYFPMLIPEKLLKREAEHVEGFAPEIAVVTHAGGKKLDEPLVVRPTSETIMYEAFSNWIQSYRDLPLLVNQWANVIRWEMRPRLFLRTSEFLWQEGHTVHETLEEADDRAKQMLEVYRIFAEDVLAVPVIPGVKSESEKFAGAFKTYTIEAMMQDGKALQFGTSHNLGQNFAKVFDVSFLGRDSELNFGWQTSWGASTRMIGGIIMTHSDDKGLVLPPKIAPMQVVLTTVGKDNEGEVTSKSKELIDLLIKNSITAHLDNSDLRPGEKFYKWEKRGVPVRIEFGPKDMSNNSAVLVRRDTGEKKDVDLNNIVKSVEELLNDIQENLFNRALKYQREKTVTVDNWGDFKSAIKDGRFVMAHWSGEKESEAEIKKETGATIRCMPFDQKDELGKCVKTGKPSTVRVLFAKSY